MPYLYIADETGEEIPGTRRTVDYKGDRKHYFAVKADLESKMGEGCIIKDSEVDG